MTKKIILLLSVVLFGIQSMAYSQTDTIYNRHKHYHYTNWYDSCYNAGHLVNRYADASATPSTIINAAYHYTEDSLEIIGIAVGVLSTEFEDTTRVPEYVMLIEGRGNNRQYEMVDTARWDTATPKIMGLNVKYVEQAGVRYDTNALGEIIGFDYLYDTIEEIRYVKICEAYFKSPITVYDSFYTGATNFNNIQTGYGYPSNLPPYPDGHGFVHQATIYQTSIGVRNCSYYNPSITTDDSGKTWYRDGDGYNEHTAFYDLVFPIIRIYDTINVVGLSADSVMGRVDGSDRYDLNSTATLTAVPHEGYKFVMWNDSVTTNPRTFTVTADTTFTAYFAPLEEYSVEVYVDDLKHGTVQGSGVYYEQSEVTISAQANDGYYFQHWNDSVAANPRTIVLTQDTTFTAYFGVGNDSTVAINAAEANTKLFTLSPNPTTKNLNITLHQTGHYTMVIYSAKGVEVCKQEISQSATIDVSALVPGTYVVKIYNDKYAGVKTFVKQ
jgi:hypothetical protein